MLFERSLELSLRDQSADWSWQSPNFSDRYRRRNPRFTNFSEEPGDCHVASLLAMTAFFGALNNNFPVQRKGNMPASFWERAWEIYGVTSPARFRENRSAI